MTMTKEKVLFLCTGNSARSQMAEALLRKHAGERYDVFSAGLEPKGINPYTVRVMNEIGISLDGQWSKDIRTYLGKVTFGRLITVCGDAEKNCPTAFLLSAGHHEHWGFDDPAAFAGTDEDTLEKFRGVRNQIDEKIQAWLGQQENQTH